MNIKKILVVVMLFSCLCGFVSYANEGMSKVGGYGEDAILSYIKEDGSCLKNEWKQVWDNWYYFDDEGKSKQNTWAEINEKWYYFDNKSIMLHDTVTPDGYTVGSDGAWLEDVPQKTE